MLLQCCYNRIFRKIKQKKLFFEKENHISCVYYLLSQRFLCLMTVKLPNVRMHCLKKQVFSANFHQQQKRVSIVSVVSIISFYYFIGNIYFNRSLPIQKIFVRWKIFAAAYLPKKCLLTKLSVSLCEVSKTLRIFEKLCLLN